MRCRPLGEEKMRQDLLDYECSVEDARGGLRVMCVVVEGWMSNMAKRFCFGLPEKSAQHGVAPPGKEETNPHWCVVLWWNPFFRLRAVRTSLLDGNPDIF